MGHEQKSAKTFDPYLVGSILNLEGAALKGHFLIGRALRYTWDFIGKNVKYI